MNHQTIIGIDPGSNGGIAVLNPNKRIETFSLKKMSDKQIMGCLMFRQPVIVYLEHVHGSPGMDPVSAFMFGRNFGRVEMAAKASGATVKTVRPQKWQSAMRVQKIGGGFRKNDTAKKNATKNRAIEIFPYLKITHAISDALLLMEFGRITEGVSR